MPKMVKDEHSGAVLFHRTSEEKRADEMEERVKKLEEMLLSMTSERTKNK